MATLHARDPDLWGHDLRLLDDLQRGDDRTRGADLAVRPRPTTRQTDLESVGGADNLTQALVLRFLTHQGELAVLGHPDYGSRLHELIGEPNTPTTRNRAKMYALTALAAEPRVAQVLSLDVSERPGDRTTIDIKVSLRIVDSATPINLVFPFFLDGSAA